MLEKNIKYFLEKLSKEDREIFLKDMESFKKKDLKRQLKDFFLKKKPFQREPLQREPLQREPLQKCENFSKSLLKKEGDKVILSKKVGIIFLAGGMGSRMKSKEPKGMLLINKKSIFEILFEKIKKSIKKYKINFPIGIMTSSFTHEKTVDFFKKNNFFGLKDYIYFFMQSDMPVLTDDGKYIFKYKKIIKAPDGTGSFFQAFKKNLMKTFINKGIKYLQIIPIDNPLCNPIDPVLIGSISFHKKDISIIAIKEPIGSMGGFFLEDGKIKIVEYMEYENKEEVKYFNAGIYCMDMDFIKKKFSLPFHHVKKDIYNIKALKAEMFIFDALKYANANIILYPRKTCFNPIKYRIKKF